MNEVRITIDNKSITCNDNESILNIARKNGIEIPAICYLSGCSPTMACKMCMVEIDGKRAYSCNAKPKDGMNVLTNTQELQNERNAIMQSYDVNHPLQCGVCDKSGECELQNYTLKMQVTKQEYSIKESKKQHKSWAKAVYDPNLCIMCERCATTCKDNLGEANLKAQKAPLEPLDSSLWKDKMPKDALSVWARKQKALIDFVGENPCFDCGECIAVCPVGALSTNDFKYKVNAWELKSTESSCHYCPMACKIIYNTRHKDTKGTQKIYRVKNDFYFNPICGAGRYAYDITSSANPKQDINLAINAFKNATQINIGNCTNEEAFVLNTIAKMLNIKLCNDEALAFKQFLATFLSFANTNCLNNLQSFESSQNIIILGSYLNKEIPALRYKLNNKLKLNKDTKAIYLHPLQDSLMQSLSKNLTQISYNAFELPNALSAIIKAFDIKNDELDSFVDLFPARLEEEQMQALSALVSAESKPLLVIGSDFYSDGNYLKLASILGLMQKLDMLSVLLIPPFGNALGIASICDLQKSEVSESSYCVGFRSSGDFVLDSNFISHEDVEKSIKSKKSSKSSESGADFILPALNQMEGTISNIEYRILPIKPALPFNGFDLSDIAKAFGLSGDYLIEYTSLICGCEFDSFKNEYLNNGSNARGFLLKNINVGESSDFAVQDSKQKPYNAYLCLTPSQFDTYTANSFNLQNKLGIYTSKEHLESLNLNSGENLTLKNADKSISASVYIDYTLTEPIFLVSPLLKGAKELFGDEKYANLALGGANE